MTDELGPVGQELSKRLLDGLTPENITIIDQSAAHAGHSGARPEGETHFHVDIACSAFDGKSRLARQRMVYDAIGDLMQTRIHALSLKTRLP